MIKTKHVKGKNKGKILLYALSTCGWCKMTKEFLDKLGVEYSFVHVDLLDDKDRDKVTEDIEKWNPQRSFPTMVINDKKCIVGFKEKEIKEALGL